MGPPFRTKIATIAEAIIKRRKIISNTVKFF